MTLVFDSVIILYNSYCTIQCAYSLILPYFCCLLNSPGDIFSLSQLPVFTSLVKLLFDKMLEPYYITICPQKSAQIGKIS